MTVPGAMLPGVGGGPDMSWGKSAGPSEKGKWTSPRMQGQVKVQHRKRNRSRTIVRTGASYESDLALQRSRRQAEGAGNLVILADTRGSAVVVGSETRHGGWKFGSLDSDSGRWFGKDCSGRTRSGRSGRLVMLFGLDGLWGGAGWYEVRHKAAEDVSEFHSVGGAGRDEAV